MAIEIGSLCERGYFPKELPTSFTTSSFGSYIRSTPLPPDTGWKEPANFNLAKAGGLRRRLSIPHPSSFHEVSKAIGANWPELERVYAQSPVFSTFPRIAPATRLRYFEGALTFDNRPKLRAKLRSRARYVVLGDISQCYRSIYSHSITWALVGKSISKAALRTRPRPTILGDDLDTATRNAQYGQTKGIPIGPDTSLAIAELILCAMDNELGRSIPTAIKDRMLPALRMIDDFEYFARTRSEAEDVLLAWETSAAHYELDLNVDKTMILELPVELEPSWKAQISKFVLRNTSMSQLQNDLVSLFSLAFELSQNHRSEQVLGYAIARANYECIPRMDQETFDVYSTLLLPSAIADPSVLRFVELGLELANARGLIVATMELEETLNEIANHHSRLEHGSEVVRSLNMISKFGLSLDKGVSENVVLMEDNSSLIVLKYLDGNSRITGGSPNLTPVMERAEAPGAPVESDWLLAYEFATHGWSNPANVDLDASLGLLRAAGVRFFDESLAEPIPLGLAGGNPPPAPDVEGTNEPEDNERPSTPAYMNIWNRVASGYA